LGKITLDFEEGKGTRDAIGMRTVMSEGNLDKDEEILCLLHSLAAGIGPCKLDQIITDHD